MTEIMLEQSIKQENDLVSCLNIVIDEIQEEVKNNQKTTKE